MDTSTTIIGSRVISLFGVLTAPILAAALACTVGAGRDGDRFGAGVGGKADGGRQCAKLSPDDCLDEKDCELVTKEGLQDRSKKGIIDEGDYNGWDDADELCENTDGCEWVKVSDGCFEKDEVEECEDADDSEDDCQRTSGCIWYDDKEKCIPASPGSCDISKLEDEADDDEKDFNDKDLFCVADCWPDDCGDDCTEIANDGNCNTAGGCEWIKLRDGFGYCVEDDDGDDDDDDGDGDEDDGDAGDDGDSSGDDECTWLEASLGTCSPDDNDDDPPDPADSDADEWDCSGTIKQADDKESCGDTFDVRSGESYTLKVSSLEHDLTRDFEIRVKLIRADKESVVRCDASTLGDGDTCDFKGSSEFQGAVKVSVSGDLANGTGEADPNADFKLKIE